MASTQRGAGGFWRVLAPAVKLPSAPVAVTCPPNLRHLSGHLSSRPRDVPPQSWLAGVWGPPSRPQSHHSPADTELLRAANGKQLPCVQEQKKAQQ